MRQKLFDRVKGVKTSKVGLTFDDILNLDVTEELIRDILEAVASSDDKDIFFGLFFAEALLQKRASENSQLNDGLVLELPRLIKSKNPRTREAAIPLFIAFRRRFPDYRNVMLECLKDASPVVRRKSLFAYQSFAKPKEFDPLEVFENDDYLTEIGMGSHLVYELRNEALEILEKLVGKTFEKSECTIMLDSGEVAFWWDWAPYHKWKKRWWRIF